MKVLIVDDSTTARTRISQFLSDNGYEVYEADTGVSGIEMLKKNKEIKLIFSDLNMPLMDGMSFIQNAREMEGFTDTPFVICTTEMCEKLKLEAKSLGVKAWVPKPFNLGRVLGLIDKIFKSV